MYQRSGKYLHVQFIPLLFIFEYDTHFHFSLLSSIIYIYIPTTYTSSFFTHVSTHTMKQSSSEEETRQIDITYQHTYITQTDSAKKWQNLTLS